MYKHVLIILLTVILCYTNTYPFNSAPSGSPGRLTVNYRLLTKAKLTWKPVPEDKRNGVITGYTVRVLGPNHICHSTKEVTADATSTEISQLNPFSLYTFSVYAKTSADTGPPASVRGEANDLSILIFGYCTHSNCLNV